ncbi:MAG: tRNA lysidine(34) synthetase TilS [Candidatus Thioglobus sp.]|nr:tRNA lysidine(34) synthetase TilS [Candidatus Thioglobus sp.]
MESLKNNDPFLKGKKLAIALSGGVDSVVLLHYLAQNYNTNLRAIHINHQLSKHSGEWQKFCQDLCFSLKIKYENIDIIVENAANIEENARKSRYLALANNLAKDEILLSAHHQNDQAETLLLQLFRGSGVAGLASMPSRKPLGKGWHYRPLLQIQKSSIMDYADRHKLRWIEDDSNFNTNFRRNFLRLEILPKLSEVYNNLGKTLSRAAGHQADALRLCEDLALIDIQQNSLKSGNRLEVSGLIKLEKYRLKNVLKFHLNSLKFLSPTAKVMEKIIELLSAKKDAKPLVSWDKFEIRRYKNQLYFINNKTNLPPPICRFQTEFEQFEGFEIRHRAEGQKVKLAGKNHSQTLKKILQEAGIPPWERQKLKMYYVSGELKAMEKIGYLQEVK